MALAATVCSAQTPQPVPPQVTIEVWSIEDRIIHGNNPPEERLLEEARVTISGMIHGWRFVYRPAYAARGVAGLWELVPIAQIPWGDPALRVRAMTTQPNTIVGQIDYSLSPRDQAARSAWQTLDTSRSAGVGEAPLLDGLAGKMNAIEDAVMHGIRVHLQQRYRNRPREAVGQVLLLEPPRIRTVSGSYEARVRIAIVVNEVLEYLTD